MTYKQWTRTAAFVAATAGVGMTLPAHAQNADAPQDLQRQIAAMQAQLAQLQQENAAIRQAQEGDWLNDRRKAEVQALIEEVLTDADGRGSFQDFQGFYAGIRDGGGAFLASQDEKFLLEIGGQMQFRYIFNFDDGNDESTERGFQIRRAKLDFAGHVTVGDDHEIEYTFVLQHDRDGGTTSLEDFVLAYEFAEGWTVAGGHFKLPFLREELISSKRQLAVDRASVTEFFTLNRAEQVQVQYDAERFKAAVAVSNGGNTGVIDYNDPAVAEIALTGRADFMVIGDDWKDNRDVVDWDGGDLVAFLGGAVHYEVPDGGAVDQFAAATVDTLVKGGGFAGLGAFTIGQADIDGGDDLTPFGVLLEGGYSVTDQIQPYVRWEYIDSDQDGLEQLQLATLGVNYYLKQHAAKFTADVVWKYAGDNLGNPFGASELSSGLGLRGTGDDDDQIAIRTQFQLLF